MYLQFAVHPLLGEKTTYLLRPYPAEKMKAWEVRKDVGNAQRSTPIDQGH
jgi:putative SOS response-associated peptidase YedK